MPKRAKPKADPLAPFIDGLTRTIWQPVKVANSRPFAEALLTEWSLDVGEDKSHLIAGKFFNVPLDVYRRIEGQARQRLVREAAARAAARAARTDRRVAP